MRVKKLGEQRYRGIRIIHCFPWFIVDLGPYGFYRAYNIRKAHKIINELS